MCKRIVLIILVLLWALTGCDSFQYCPEETPAELWKGSGDVDVEPDNYFLLKRQQNQNQLNLHRKYHDNFHRYTGIHRGNDN